MLICCISRDVPTAVVVGDSRFPATEFEHFNRNLITISETAHGVYSVQTSSLSNEADFYTASGTFDVY